MRKKQIDFIIICRWSWGSEVVSICYFSCWFVVVCETLSYILLLPHTVTCEEVVLRVRLWDNAFCLVGLVGLLEGCRKVVQLQSDFSKRATWSVSENMYYCMHAWGGVWSEECNLGFQLHEKIQQKLIRKSMSFNF